jgi:gluconolactonase
MRVSLLLLVGCTPTVIDYDTGTDPSDDTGVVDTDDTDTDDTDTDDTDTDDTDTDDSGDTDDTGEKKPHKVDCENPIELPVAFETLPGFSTAEDFTFDGDGRLIAIRQGNLVGFTAASDFDIIAPGFGEMAGTSILAGGDYVLANPNNGTVVRVTPEGGQTIILTGVNYPNGVTVSTDDLVYVSGHTYGDIYQIDPDTAESTIIARGIPGANGMSFSPDGQTLYICSFYDGTVWALDRDGKGDWDEPRLLGQMSGGWAGLDGLNVDECGFVYVTEYVAGIVWRIDPFAETFDPQQVASLPSYWIPNLHWGREGKVFSKDILYVSDRESGRLFALDLGVRGTPQSFDDK